MGIDIVSEVVEWNEVHGPMNVRIKGESH
jgi:hypothetical protein